MGIFRLHDMRRVMPELLDREDASLSRMVQNLGPAESEALGLLIQALKQKMLAEERQNTLVEPQAGGEA